MFKDDYKECNKNIKPDPVLINNILYKKRTRKRREQSLSKHSFIHRAGSIAAAILIAFSSILIVYNSSINDQFVTGVDSYSEVYDLIKAMNHKNFLSDIRNESSKENAIADGAAPNAQAPQAEVGDSNNTSGNKAPEYSDTNLQVLGVQEADIVKTDGKYIYAVSVEYIYIIEVNGEQLSIASKIERSTNSESEDKKSVANSYVQELYITKNRLILIKATSYNKYYEGYNSSEPAVMPDSVGSKDIYYMPYYSYSYETSADIYDTTDKTSPKFLNSLGQSGYYLSSRMIGDSLYLITNQYIYENQISASDASTYIPKMYNAKLGDSLVKPKDICIAPNPQYYNYLVVTGINALTPDKHVSSKTIFGSGATIYASTNNLYVTAYSYKENMTYTDIIKFALNDGDVMLKATGAVPGYLLNQFSMDEHKGYFRVCTTTTIYNYTEGGNATETKPAQVPAADGTISQDAPAIWTPPTTFNNLYVLDENLKIVGKIEGLAKGETIHSVRFDGDVGYFVTFRRTDPLFAVDLSVPAEPKILSELKIPGFSQYMHVYKDNLLFGLGMDADPETGMTLGLKISMFDIADKTNITEKHKLLLGQEHYYSEAQYNHKAILVAPDKNIIGFYSASTGKYLIYSYDESTGFTSEAELQLGRNEGNAYDYYWYIQNARGFYIDNYLYVYNTNSIQVFSLETFKEVSSLTLYDGAYYNGPYYK